MEREVYDPPAGFWWKMGLKTGVIFGAFMTLVYAFMAPSLKAAVITGIGVGIFFGIFFPLAMKLFGWRPFKNKADGPNPEDEGEVKAV